MILRRLIKLGINPKYSRFIHIKTVGSNGEDRKTSNWVKHERTTDYSSGHYLARELEKETEIDLFPSFSKFGIETNSRVHSFTTTCDNVIKYIKLGAINKNIAFQYCHYLAYLCRNCSDEDHAYYHRRAFNLMNYLLQNGKGSTDSAKIMLLCDVADSSASNCTAICNESLDQYKLRDKLSVKDISKIMNSCYKYGLWKIANSMVEAHHESRIVNPRLFDPLIKSLIDATSTTEGGVDRELDDCFKNDFIEHLLKLIEIGYRDRVQFITKYPQEFIKGLESLGVKVVRNPRIKLSGRCTHCDTILPVYDHKITSKLNVALKEVLNQSVGDGLNLNCSPEDLTRFDKFLQNIHQIDRKPLDCVIDGPNICYRNTAGYFFHKKEVAENVHVTYKRHNPGSQIQVLVNTILRANMLQIFKKILVIGKEHMSKWPGLIEFFERNKIHYYFSANDTKDDLLQLYASTMNPKTILLTNDFLRDHLALVEGENRIMLERWIDTHQGWVAKKNLQSVWPTPFEKIPSVNRETGYFHIPIIDYNKLDQLALHEAPPHLNSKMTSWICCRKARSNE